MAAKGLAPEVGVKPACNSLGVARATFYRRPGTSSPGPRPPGPFANRSGRAP
jgi:hypothetical protein